MRKAEKAVRFTITEVSDDDMQCDERELEAFILPNNSDNEAEEIVSRSRIICLTCGLGGLQVVWSVILSNGSPYLVSLGLSKSLTALVWIAAPLCGTVIQPLVGSWSDHVSTRWGRRRPFILAGAIGITISMVFLAWASELIHFAMDPGRPTQSLRESDATVIAFAIFWIYALNIAIQPVQAGLRSLIVETLSVHQQSQASTYASVMQGLGNILGYLFGFGVLPVMATTSMTLFQRLSIFASVCLCITVAVTCITTSEKLPNTGSTTGHDGQGIRTAFNRLVRIYAELPCPIRRVCQVQFLSWMAWFPFLYYSTTYVGEFYAGKLLFLEHLKSGTAATTKNASDITESRSTISQEAIRYGTFASFLFAMVAFIYSIVFPDILNRIRKSQLLIKGPETIRYGIAQAWMCSHVYFALLMFSTFFVRSEAAATAVVAFAGLSWALTLFAPYAIISTELATQRAMNEDESANSTEEEPAQYRCQTGAIMGLHNMAISLPQILAALLCSAIYASAKALELADGTGWVLRAGGVFALGAAWLCRRFND